MGQLQWAGGDWGYSRQCVPKLQQVCFVPTAEPPVAHLVHHMLPRALAFPIDSSAQSAADETAVQLSELLTLPVLMKRSLTAPLAAQ